MTNGAQVAERSQAPPLRPDVLAREAEWLVRPSRGIAFDLVSVAATSVDPSPVAREAARWILEDGHPSRMVRLAAEHVLRPGVGQVVMNYPPEETDEGDAKARLRGLRASLGDDPRNAIAWAEAARMYVSIGQGRPADKAMHRALALAPNHRYFLRSAARLSIHRDEPDRAHALLMASPRTARDPWLMASEISVAGLAESKPRLVKDARTLIERRRWSSADLTELTSALGTVELQAGKSRRARDLFRSSLEAPNDNSLAQAEWAADRLSGVHDRLRIALDEVPKSFEARSMDAAGNGHHAEAVKEAWFWLLDQPFSAEPAAFGSYEAALTRDFERGLAWPASEFPRHRGDQ